jgi:DNA-binding SARP family transcriptional activator
VNTAEDLRVYTTLCRVLRDELGISPNPSARSLHSTIMRAQDSHRARNTTVGALRRHLHIASWITTPTAADTTGDR